MKEVSDLLYENVWKERARSLQNKLNHSEACRMRQANYLAALREWLEGYGMTEDEFNETYRKATAMDKETIVSS